MNPTLSGEWTKDKRQGIGDRKQETGNRKQEIGVISEASANIQAEMLSISSATAFSTSLVLPR
jgi:hypothetical protein